MDGYHDTNSVTDWTVIGADQTVPGRPIHTTARPEVVSHRVVKFESGCGRSGRLLRCHCMRRARDMALPSRTAYDQVAT